MRPIRTVESNFTYLGPTPEVADLPGQREEGRFYSVWRLSDADREKIAAGANIELGIYAQPIPPVSLSVVDVPEVALSAQGRDHRCANLECEALYVGDRALDLKHKCGQCGGELQPVESDFDLMPRHEAQVRSWVDQGKSETWIAHQLEVRVDSLRDYKRELGLALEEQSS